jgi:hypothetical protein
MTLHMISNMTSDITLNMLSDVTLDIISFMKPDITSSYMTTLYNVKTENANK